MQPVAPLSQSVTLGKSHRMAEFTSQSSSKERMEVWSTSTHVILSNRRLSLSLWCSKEDGKILPGKALDEEVLSDPRQLESVYGVIGKIKFIPDSDWKLLVITRARKIGRLPPMMAKVYCIEQVTLIPLSVDNELQKMESLSYERREKDKEREKLEKKLTEELYNMFNGSQSYYFSYNTDLTQSLQRQEDCGDADKLRPWQRVDERFFWNKHMITELIDGSFGTEVDPWVLPIIQGYIEIRNIPIPSPSNLGVFKDYDCFKNSTSVIDMNTFTIIEKDGDNFSFQEYSSPDDTEGSGNISPPKDMHTPTGCHDDSNLTPQPSPPHPIRSTPNKQPPSIPVAATDTVAIDTVATDIVAMETPPDVHQRQCIDSLTSIDSDEATNMRYEALMEDIEEEEEQKIATLHRWTGQKLSLSPEGLPLITMALISRRSRYRAGTRYLKRGVDRDGHVANFVETEMILLIDSHVLSFVIVRGSVPVYWNQPGHKYRPTPILQQDDAETQKAFTSHFEQQVNIYGEAVIINLVNRTGKERIIGRAFEQQLLQLNYPGLTYVGFDFHDHCKVNQWHNIYMLLDEIEPYLNHQKYFWVDLNYSTRPHCVQNGVFRVNCMDCLDRTNVVQSVTCKCFLQTILPKLGLLGPFEPIAGQFLLHYQSMWANNGDVISKQYTGTIAMKGDLTRYGHRKLYGVMKDGYNSANRYLKSVFKDAYRQVVIDLQQGMSPQEALLTLPRLQRNAEDTELQPPLIGEYSPWSSEREQAVQEMIDVCKRELYPNTPVLVQGWALLEAAGYSFIPSSTKEEDTVLLLCEERRHICVANYSSEFEQVACCLRIPLERIDRIVVGPIGTLLRSSRQVYMRLHYTLFPNHSCYFTFQTIRHASYEEDKLLLLSIAQEIVTMQPTIAIQEHRLAKKQSQAHEGVVFLIAPSEWSTNEWGLITEQNQPLNQAPPTSQDSSHSSSPINTMYEALYESLPSIDRVQTHSRQSSSTSGIALITFSDTESKRTVSTSSSTDASHDEGDSFSAPNSPSFQRRMSFMTLEERSRLLSHSSYNDLSSLAVGEADVNEDSTQQYTHSLSDTELDSEDDDVVMGQVLSTPRLPSKGYVPSPIAVTVDTSAQSDVSAAEGPSLGTTPTASTGMGLEETNISAGGKYLSRLKGKLFPKVQPSQAIGEGSRSRSDSNEKSSSLSRSNVTQVISILRNIGGQQDDRDKNPPKEGTRDTPSPLVIDDDLLVQQCLAANKTRFIFI